MDIFKKLEALATCDIYDDGEQVWRDKGGRYILADDLQVIIEEAKKQEPVGYVDEFGNFEKSLQQWMQDEPNVAWNPVYPHPQLSDEIVKDAARWNKLLDYVGAHIHPGGHQNFHLSCLSIPDGVNLLHGCVSQHFTKIIDEAMKADNVSE